MGTDRLCLYPGLQPAPAELLALGLGRSLELVLFTEARQRSGSGRVLQLQQSSVLSLPCCPGASGSEEDQDVLSCPWLGAPQSQHGSPPALVGTSAIPGQWQGAFVHTILLPSLSLLCRLSRLCLIIISLPTSTSRVDVAVPGAPH